MCTAITYQTHDFYFGRNLDYEFSYGESVAVTPRRYPFSFHKRQKMQPLHAAFIGMAHVENEFPLYYDAVNELRSRHGRAEFSKQRCIISRRSK